MPDGATASFVLQEQLSRDLANLLTTFPEASKLAAETAPE